MKNKFFILYFIAALLFSVISDRVLGFEVYENYNKNMHFSKQRQHDFFNTEMFIMNETEEDNDEQQNENFHLIFYYSFSPEKFMNTNFISQNILFEKKKFSQRKIYIVLHRLLN